MFIGGNNTVKVMLPAGLYTVKSGEGSDWFGEKESFGRYGHYETMTFDGKEEIKLQEKQLAKAKMEAAQMQ